MKKLKLAFVLLGVIVLGLTSGCAKNDAQKDLDKYGNVEEETVDVLIAKFNTEIMDGNDENLNPASDDYLTVDNKKYWYGLEEGIYLVAVPIEFSNDKTKDIVDYMFLYVDKDGDYETDPITYAKYLIKANNTKITDEEINDLIKDAKQKESNKRTATNGKGISVGYLDNKDNYQYQVKRFYK